MMLDRAPLSVVLVLHGTMMLKSSTVILSGTLCFFFSPTRLLSDLNRPTDRSNMKIREKRKEDERWERRQTASRGIKGLRKENGSLCSRGTERGRDSLRLGGDLDSDDIGGDLGSDM